jgi:cytidylate kinase
VAGSREDAVRAAVGEPPRRRARGIVIAIDGPAAAGKSTTARAVAAALGYAVLDTGAMYRAVTLAALRAGVVASEGPAVDALLAGLGLALEPSASGTRVLLHGADEAEAIRRPEVTAAVSAFSALASVRAAMVARQRELGAAGGVVVEGRDIGTVVFPDAELKVFLEASLDERARRRGRDLAAAGHAAADAAIATDLARRDAADASRAVSPLSRAADAVPIDTSTMTFDEQVEAILDLARERGA